MTEENVVDVNYVNPPRRTIEISLAPKDVEKIVSGGRLELPHELHIYQAHETGVHGNPPGDWKCPNDGHKLESMGWKCPKCGYTRGENPKSKAILCPQCGSQQNLEDVKEGDKCWGCGAELNPKSKSWLMERRTKFRHQTGADSTTKPDSRSRLWVKGHRRSGGFFGDDIKVRGHYRKANPDDFEIQKSMFNPYVFFVSRSEEELPRMVFFDTDKKEWKSDVPNSEEFIGAVRKYVVTKKNPPEDHEHALKFVGACNPKGSNEQKDLYECVECKKRFVFKE